MELVRKVYSGLSVIVLSSSLFAHGVCETDRIDIHKAKESIEAILLEEPNNVTCMLQLANIHLKQGNISKGFEILVDAYSIEPYKVQSSPVAEVLPFALKVSNLKKQAISTNDQEMWNKLGDGYFEMGIYNEAVEMYKKSLLANEQQLGTRVKLALTLQKNCQTYRAIEELKKILSRDKDHLYAHYYMGKILMHDVKNESEALLHFRKAKHSLVANKESFGYLEYANLLSDITKELKE